MRLIDEGALTRSRHERKRALSPEAARELARELERRCGIEPSAETCLTSVYFDLPDDRLAATARASPWHCLKVRTKEYDPDLGSPLGPRCALELKRRRGTWTRKQRFWVPRAELAAIFGDGRGLGPEARAARRLLLATAGPGLEPRFAVTYLRRIYPLGEGLRVTFDRALAFHRAPAALLLGPEPLRLARLPAAAGGEARVIVEVKHLGAVPGWAAGLFPGREDGFSKFAAALALLGRAPEATRASV